MMPEDDFLMDLDSLEKLEELRETKSPPKDHDNDAADSNTVVVDGNLLQALNKRKSTGNTTV